MHDAKAVADHHADHPLRKTHLPPAVNFARPPQLARLRYLSPGARAAKHPRTFESSPSSISTMAETLLLQDDDEYNSASDEEFDPTNTAAAAEAASDDDASSTSDDDNNEAPTKPRKTKATAKRKRGNADGELDSGDEATIAAARRRRGRDNKKQRQTTADADDDGVAFLSDEDDQGGEGGLVKTRAQRRQEQHERARRPLARVDGATADVDAIWAALSTVPVGQQEGRAEEDEEEQERDDKAAAVAAAPEEEPPEEEMVTIKRTYDFAGDRITEERQVPKASAEARLYLAQQQQEAEKQRRQAAAGKKTTDAAEETTPDGGAQTTEEDGDVKAKSPEGDTGKPFIRRPLHRPSRFDANPTAEVRTLPPEKQLTWARRRALLDPAAAALLPTATTATASADDASAALAARKTREKAQKLNTVDKSRLDWAGYVDKEGIADELDEYGRAKEGYLGRMDFLERVDQRKEEERRAVKTTVKT